MSEQELMDELDKIMLDRLMEADSGSSENYDGYPAIRARTNNFLVSRKRKPKLPRTGEAFAY